MAISKKEAEKQVMEELEKGPIEWNLLTRKGITAANSLIRTGLARLDRSGNWTLYKFDDKGEAE